MSIQKLFAVAYVPVGAVVVGISCVVFTFALEIYALPPCPKKLKAANNPYSLVSSPTIGVAPLFLKKISPKFCVNSL